MRGFTTESPAPEAAFFVRTHKASSMAPLIVSYRFADLVPQNPSALWRESDSVLSHHSSVTDYIFYYTFRRPLCQAKLLSKSPLRRTHEVGCVA